MNISYNEFHVSRAIRDKCGFDMQLYSSSGNVVFKDLKAVRIFQTKLNELFDQAGKSEKRISAGSLNAMGLIDEIFHYVCMIFRREKKADSFSNLMDDLDSSFGKNEMDKLLLQFMEEFPPVAVYQKKLTTKDYLFQTCMDAGTGKSRTNREQVLEEMILLHLANENPAFHPFQILFDDTKLQSNADYIKTWNQIKAYFKTQPVFGPENHDLITMLKEPVKASPTSLKGQLDYIRVHWADLLGDWLRRLLEGIDTITEEEKAMWHPVNGGEVQMDAYSYENMSKEYERFSPDRDWMPKVVLMAKTVLVWLDQLSKKYKRDIKTLDQIPDQELDNLHNEGFTGLWLIGLWERSYASRRIKQINGNPEAAASAYSLLDYEIAGNLGGWSALENLRKRCWQRGIRLASDMVPNHTGMDGKWVIEHPDYFISTKDNPFPQYVYNGENLSRDGRVSVYLEDHYYSKTDCAVCFKRVDNQTGDVTYIYHGNDGTGMPWNDTAQIDFLNPQAREAVMQQILKVASNFPIIRFDAAMVLAKKHIRRLWYPEPGHGGDIATRSQHALTSDEFNARIPNEFWREVVDRCAQEMPDTLLLAEAFWMMEGYFTRTLGMHRVYNSAFMNMLKKEENQKYRDTVKNTIKFDPQILKRFVNFMNNPDEETAVAQFGDGDKYFGVCTLMCTMPGLPMFGHGQIEGFTEKYGMEYTKAYKDEKPNEGLISRHWHDIFPLLHKRYLFAQIENFLFYDVWDNGHVNENIFAYSNGVGNERTIVFYNNKYEKAQGWIKQSCEYAVKTGSGEDDKVLVSKTLAEGLGLTWGEKNFMIFKEQRSGLWFVRSSNDIISNGMYIGLNGFESQVYLEVHQVKDDPDGKYSKLCELLNGRGSEDLDIEWQEYQYKELYKALSKFLSDDFYSQIKLLFTPSPVLKAAGLEQPKIKDFYDSIKKDALEYYELEEKFANLMIQNKWNAFEKEAIAARKAKKKIKRVRITKAEKTIAAVSPEERFLAFTKGIDFLIATNANAQGISRRKAAASKERSGESVLKVKSDSEIYQMITEQKGIAEILASFTAVASAGTPNAKKWGLARKLDQYLKEREIECTVNARDILSRMFILMQIHDMNFGAAAQVRSTWETAKLLVDGPDSNFLTGANDFDGTRWFNKERMESTLFYGFIANATLTQRGLREQICRLFKTLNAAQSSADYKAKNFTDSLKPLNMEDEEEEAEKETEKKIEPKSEGKDKKGKLKTSSKKSSKD